MIDLSGYDFTDNYVESRLKEVSDEGALYSFHLCTTVMESLIIKHCLRKMDGSCQHLLQSLKNLQTKQKKQELRYVWHRFSTLVPPFSMYVILRMQDSFSTMSGKQWQKDYLSGKANVSNTPGMMESMEYIQKWKDLWDA